jgi:hypothetical protein
MPEVMVGHVKGPVGHAFAAMAGQVAGHPRYPRPQSNGASGDHDDHQDDGALQ